MNIELTNYQDGFLFSRARFPMICSAVGTGKTLILLVKAWNFAEEYSDSLILIVRKEFVDLRDSTMADFEKYFGVKIGSDKNYTLANGSKIMFRHSSELNILKNLNLNMACIEQMEEIEEETFDFIRDRLRRQTSPYRQLCGISNARGHNFIWQRWIEAAETIDEIDRVTGQYHYIRGDYECWTANSFANRKNLPADFVKDLETMKQDAPNHYAQYVMNSFEDLEEDDLLFTFSELQDSVDLQLPYKHEQYTARVLSGDIARYGQDKNCVVVLKQYGPMHWIQEYYEQWGKKDLMYTTGRIMDIRTRFQPLITVIDGDGMGAGPVDRMIENGIRDVVEFRGGQPPYAEHNKTRYNNRRTEGYMTLRDMVVNGTLRIKSDAIHELQTIRFTYNSKGQKMMLSKEQMRSDGVKSPNHGDALMMACSEVRNVGDVYRENRRHHEPQYAKETSVY